MHRIDGPYATVDNKFSEGNPATGVEATWMTDDWANSVQEELAAVIEAAGIVLDKANNTQLLAAIQTMGMLGAPSILAVETTLTAAHGMFFANPAEGEVISYHLPIYGTVAAHKRYRVKNIGQGIARIDAADAKTIDGDAILDLAPNDRAELAKDTANWQTI